MPIQALRTLLVVSALAAPLSGAAEGLAISASSAGSSASSAGSASLRGSSDSIGASSDSSRRDRAVLDGEYRVAAVRRAPHDPALVRLHLDPVAAAAGAAPFRLDVPERALGRAPLAVGDAVRAQRRPYGLEFARLDTREPFFLVLDDTWHRDLQTRVVTR